MPLHLEQAVALEHVGDTLYIGFNEDLERVSFPKLRTVGGALIIESNPALRRIDLPALELVARYIHIHDSIGLVELLLPRVQSVGGELSLLGCPQLKTVRVGAASRPASVTRLEVKDCGAPVFPGLHARATGG
jgi:hypothetical protein